MRKHMARALAQENGEKISAKEFWRVEEPTLQETLVLDLARAIEKSKDTDYAVVSWASQEEAIRYYNEHGFIAALTRLNDLT